MKKLHYTEDVKSCGVRRGSVSESAAQYDPALARSLGANENGMRSYVLIATDPVIVNGEMVAEYHKFFVSAGLMAVNDTHAKLQKQ